MLFLKIEFSLIVDDLIAFYSMAHTHHNFFLHLALLSHTFYIVQIFF
jgi:hypothetical protein